MKKIFVLFSILQLLLFATNTEKIKVVVPSNFPPYYILDKNNNISGFAVEVFDEIAKSLDIKSEYIIKDSFSQAEKFFLSGYADVIPNSGVSLERSQNSLFTSPVDTMLISAFKRSNSDNIKTLDDINNKKVVVVNNNIGKKLMKNHPLELLTIVNTKDEAVFLLLSGSVDIFIFPKLPILKLLKELNIKDKIVPLEDSLIEIKRAIRIQKNNPNLALKLDIAIQEFIKTKQFEDIYIKWFGKHNYVEFEKRNIYIVAIVSLLLILVLTLIFFMYLKSNKLKEKLEESNLILKNNRKELQKEKSLYKSFIENASDAIFIVDMNGHIFEYSNQFKNILGYSHKEILKLHVSDYEAIHTKEQIKENIKNVTEVPLQFESKYKKKNGELIDVLLKIVKVEIDGKDFVYSSFTDITESKKLQKDILTQKEEFETIFNYSQDGIAILDLESRFLKFNDAYLNLSGFTKEELLKKTCLELTAAEDIDRTMEALEHVIIHGYINSFEKTCILKDGIRKEVNISVSLLPDKRSFLMVTKDTTTVKLLEKQSKLASMGEMIGNIAHQWRQPLSVITTTATGLKLNSDLGILKSDDIDKFSDSIVEQANYLSRTIDNFRNFIKNDESYNEVSLKESLQISLTLLSASLSNNFITLVQNLEDDLLIYGNKNELSEAFINIINNSKDILKHSINNDEDKLIFINTEKLDENAIKLIIYDSGGGIDENVISKIFEPYFTTKHKSQGTGLGLSMVDKILRDRYKAQIDVYNKKFTYNKKEYVGACFEITFNK